jgi:hypothetical protein
MRPRLLAFALVAAGIAGCDDTPTMPLESSELLRRLALEGCPTPTRLAPSSWTSVSGSAFRIRIPDGFRQVAVQPVDSETALFESAAGVLTYDYGPESAGIPDEEAPSIVQVVARCETEIDGRAVELGHFRVGQMHVLAAWWPNLGEAFGGPANLTLVGRSASPGVVDDLLATLLSVEVL